MTQKATWASRIPGLLLFLSTTLAGPACTEAPADRTNAEAPAVQTNEEAAPARAREEVSPDRAQGAVDPAASITAAELREHITFLADDKLEGRYVGSDGYEIAARYAAAQFSAAGLDSLRDAGLGDDAYLQPVPFRRVTDRGSLHVHTPEGDIELRGDVDFKYLICMPGKLPEGPLLVTFVGYGIEEPEAGWNDYDGLDVEGSVAIMLPGAPLRGGEPALPVELHDLYSGGEGDGRRFWALRNRRPAAFILRTNGWRAANWETIANDAARFRLVYADPDGRGSVTAGGRRGFGNQIVIREESLNRMFAGQAYSPEQLPDNGIDGYRTFSLVDASIELRFELAEEEHQSYNVVGLVRGADPDLADEYIVVGAHLDHVPPAGGQINNGADDNASGSAGVIELAEALNMAPPRRSVVLILYTGEEVGLIGSHHFLAHGPIPADQIVANLNLDMIGRTAPENRGNRAHYVVSEDGEEAPLSQLVGRVNAQTVGWPLVFADQADFPGGSDHQSFAARGIPAVFFFSGHHRDLHRPTDDANRIEYDKVQALSRLVHEIVMELGNAESPLR